jgi:membrane protease YdiL (CAAX protease family)
MFIQHLVPGADFPSHLLQDEYITIFRLGCGVTVCLLYWHYWTMGGLLQWKKMPTWVWLGGLFLVAANVVCAMASHQASPFEWRIIVIDLIVGFNEEVAFRGLFQRALTEIKGIAWGEWLGSLMFTAMHLGYQPISNMGYIFIWGLAAAKLRNRGAAIGFLIVIHWIADSAYVVFWKDAVSPRPWLLWVQWACLMAALGASWLAKNQNVGQKSEQMA